VRLRFLVLRGLLKSINSSPSGFFLRALALGRETLRTTVRVTLRRRGGLRRRAAERFTNCPFFLRGVRRRELVFLRGLINRTRLNCGICLLPRSLKCKTPRVPVLRTSAKLEREGRFLKISY
jgi:hypothetical protein